MTDGALEFMGFVPDELRLSASVGDAVSCWLRHRHPANTAKLVAREIDSDPRTVESMLAGHLTGPHLTRLLRAYGWEFLTGIGAAVLGETYEAHIHRQIEEIANEREELGRREQSLRGAYARVRARSAVDRGGLRLVGEEDGYARRPEGRTHRGVGAASPD